MKGGWRWRWHGFRGFQRLPGVDGVRGNAGVAQSRDSVNWQGIGRQGNAGNERVRGCG